MSDDTVGLGVSDSDQLTLLVRSLPETAKQYVLHHSTGESYSSYRSSALRWEHQQRLLVELQGSKKFFSIGEFGDDKTEESKDGDVPSETQEGQVFGVKGGSKGSGSGLGSRHLSAKLAARKAT